MGQPFCCFINVMVRQQYSCFILNFYLVLCGLLLVIISSTLSLKTVHQTVFFTLAFESLLSLCLYNKKRTPKGVLFMVRQQYSCFILNFYLVLCGLFLVIISSTLSLKTVHRTVFFTLAFESLLSLCLYNKKRTPKGVLFMVRQQYSCFILNFYLVLCGLFLVIISSTLSLKTVHRTVFFTLAFESLLSLCLYNKKRTPKGVLFMVRQQGLEPRTDRL